jgi:hypothetical protein
MRFRRDLAAAVVLCSLAGLGMGCGAKRGASDYAVAYRRLASDAVTLYTRLEPLRSSRLGIIASDSLLFTYSDDEIEGALRRGKRLEARFSTIPAGRLNAGDINRAIVIINWLRGAVFAFEDLESARWNPLIYCWTAEDALWVVPSRVVPPYEGELEAYRKRILRIPSLFSNGEAHLNDTAEWHVRYAIERLDTLAAALPELAALLRERYGTSLDAELESVRSSILGFRRFASETLLPASRGRLILGSENLSTILLYNELINADPNMLAAEGQKQIRRLEHEKSSVAKRIEFMGQQIPQAQGAAALAANEPFESRIKRLLERLRETHGADSTGGAAAITRPAIDFPARPEYVSRSDKAPYLSIPPAGSSDATTVTPPLSAPSCRTRLALSAGAAREGDGPLRFALLCTTPRIMEMEKLRCEARDTAAAVFSSATFDEGWRYLALQEIVPAIKKSDPELYLLVLDDWIMKYARMTVVFALHAGTMTSDSAIQYLADSRRMSRDDAAREVLIASTSPAVAYPAISMITVDEMLRNVSYVFGYGKPNEELAKLLRASRDLPLSMIAPKTRSD